MNRNLKQNYFYIEFEIINLDRFKHLQVMFAKLKEVKNDFMGFCDAETQDSSLDYRDPVEDFNWSSYLDEEAKAWFANTFDYNSEEDKIYTQLWNLTHYKNRRHPFLRTPGNWDLEYYNSLHKQKLSLKKYHLVPKLEK